mgnify:FL=1|jgi:hypothetical protein
MQTAEQLFNDNVRYAKALIKRRPIGTAGRWRWELVNPDKVIEELQKHGVDITVRTLQRWVKDGLLPEPKRGTHGRGTGSWADYPDETIPEALTVSILKDVYRLKHSEIAEARKAYKERKLAPYAATWGAMLRLIKDEGYESAKRGGPLGFEFYRQAEEYLYGEQGEELRWQLSFIREFLRLHKTIKKNETMIEEKLKTGEITGDMPLSEALEILESMKPNDS